MQKGRFTLPRTKLAPLPPEANPWWWNPRRPIVPKGPDRIIDKLEAVDPGLSLTWNNYTGRWQVWVRSDKINHKICSGWRLLFIVHPADLGEGDAILARLYNASTDRWGNAKHYAEAIEREQLTAKAKQEKQSTQDSVDQATEVFEYSQIKNIGKGSKFATYHQ